MLSYEAVVRYCPTSEGQGMSIATLQRVELHAAFLLLVATVKIAEKTWHVRSLPQHV